MTVTPEKSDMTSTPTQNRRERIVAALTADGIAQWLSDSSPELSKNADVVLERRYRSKDREGNILEDSNGLFRRVARNLSQAELDYGASRSRAPSCRR